jgi:hypothetical protein
MLNGYKPLPETSSNFKHEELWAKQKLIGIKSNSAKKAVHLKIFEFIFLNEKAVSLRTPHLIL